MWKSLSFYSNKLVEEHYMHRWIRYSVLCSCGMRGHGGQRERCSCGSGIGASHPLFGYHEFVLVKVEEGSASVALAVGGGVMAV